MFSFVLYAFTLEYDLVVISSFILLLSQYRFIMHSDALDF